MTLDNFDIPNDRAIEYRGFRLVYTDPYGHLHAETIGKGSIPACLEGTWTSMDKLKQEVDRYLALKEEKENKPPQDKDTRKVQEWLANKEPSTAQEAVDATFNQAHVEVKKSKSK